MLGSMLTESDLHRTKCEYCGTAFVATQREAMLDALRSHLLDCAAFGVRPVLRAAMRIRIAAEPILVGYERFMACEHAAWPLSEKFIGHDALDRLRDACRGVERAGAECRLVAKSQAYDRAADPHALAWDGHVRAGGD